MEQGVAILRLQSPPVNALSKVLLDALHVNVAKAHSDTKAKAIVIISNIPKFFVAGADISEIKKRQATEDGESMHYFTFFNLCRVLRRFFRIKQLVLESFGKWTKTSSRSA